MEKVVTTTSTLRRAPPPKIKSKLKKQKVTIRRAKAKVAAPVSISNRVLVQSPSISTSGFQSDGSSRIRHREYIADISGSAPFSVQSFPINPGQAQTFPWLSTIAVNYESYLFNSLSFSYESDTSTSVAGRAMLAIDFDASDDPPSSKTTMMQYHNAVASNVWDECIYTASKADLDKFGKQRYVRTGTLPPGSDIKTLDVGNLFVATKNVNPVPLIVGELWVTYDVTLHTPQVPSVIGPSLSSLQLFSSAHNAGNDLHVDGPFHPYAVRFNEDYTTQGYGRLPVQIRDPFSLVINKIGTYLITSNIVSGGPLSLFSSNSLTVGAGNTVVQRAASNVPAQSFFAVYAIEIKNLEDPVIFWNPPAPTGNPATDQWINGYLFIAPYDDGVAPYAPYQSYPLGIPPT